MAIGGDLLIVQLFVFAARNVSVAQRTLDISIDLGFFRLQASIFEKLPGRLLTRDNLLSMRVPSVCDAALPFGIVPTALEAVVPLYMAHAAPRERLGELRHKANR